MDTATETLGKGGFSLTWNLLVQPLGSGFKPVLKGKGGNEKPAIAFVNVDLLGPGTMFMLFGSLFVRFLFLDVLAKEQW